MPRPGPPLHACMMKPRILLLSLIEIVVFLAFFRESGLAERRGRRFNEVGAAMLERLEGLGH